MQDFEGIGQIKTINPGHAAIKAGGRRLMSC